jgi:hypothetical protein
MGRRARRPWLEGKARGLSLFRLAHVGRLCLVACVGRKSVPFAQSGVPRNAQFTVQFVDSKIIKQLKIQLKERIGYEK